MHIVIVNRWPRFSDGVRWDNELTRYEEFIDHDAHRVSYVVDPLGAEGVLADPAKIAAQVQVDDVNDFEALRDAVAEITRRVGPVDSSSRCRVHPGDRRPGPPGPRHPRADPGRGRGLPRQGADEGDPRPKGGPGPALRQL